MVSPLALQFYNGCRASLLIDGPATYGAMLEAISQAKQYIYLETYIFADDVIGRRIAAALIRKRRQGVVVRIIYDSLGSIDSDVAFFERLEKHGIELIEFHKFNPLRSGNLLNSNVRDHRKMLVVDRLIAFTGGINLSNTYSSGSRGQSPEDAMKTGWRDTHVAIRGPAVFEFAKLFERLWQAQGGSTANVNTDASGQRQVGMDKVAVVASEGGNDSESPILNAYMDAIRQAQNRIWITQAYFAPKRRFLRLLKRAAKRGVDVRLIVPGLLDAKLLLHASRSRYGSLLRRGVQIFEATTTLLHAKTALVDDNWTTIGSSNLDTRSSLHNHEVNAVILSEEFTEQMARQFTTDLQLCHRVSLLEWNKRPPIDRVLESFSRWIDYWI